MDEIYDSIWYSFISLQALKVNFQRKVVGSKDRMVYCRVHWFEPGFSLKGFTLLLLDESIVESKKMRYLLCLAQRKHIRV